MPYGIDKKVIDHTLQQSAISIDAQLLVSIPFVYAQLSRDTFKRGEEIVNELVELYTFLCTELPVVNFREQKQTAVKPRKARRNLKEVLYDFRLPFRQSRLQQQFQLGLEHCQGSLQLVRSVLRKFLLGNVAVHIFLHQFAQGMTKPFEL